MNSDLNLPPGYTYMCEKEGDTDIIRIKEVTDEKTAMVWVKEFSKVTCVTWRSRRTYPHSGRKLLFKLDMRCQHRTDRRVTGQREGKNTDCAASLQITVRRLVKYSRSKSAKTELFTYPACVRLQQKHNHSLVNAAALKHRDMTHETRLDQKLGTAYNVVSDSVKEILFKVSAGHNPPEGWLLQLKIQPVTSHPLLLTQSPSSLTNTNPVLLDLQQEPAPVQPSCAIAEPYDHEKTVEITQFLEELFSRLRFGLETDPRAFLPVMEKFMKNAKQYAATETGLFAALSTFGKYNATESFQLIEEDMGSKSVSNPQQLADGNICFQADNDFVRVISATIKQGRLP